MAQQGYSDIQRSFINMFKSGYEQSFQQKIAKFRNICRVENQSSEFEFYDRIGLADDMNEVTTRYGDTPMNEVPHERRRNQTRDYDWGKGIDDKDLLRVLQDPTSEYTQAALASANRRLDRIIINAITATAFTGKAGETAVNFVGNSAGKINVGEVSDPNGNIVTGGMFTRTAGMNEGVRVASDWSKTGATGTHTNITTEKLIAVRETLLNLEAIEPGTPLTMFVSPNQQSALLTESGNRVISTDFNATRTLVNGVVDSWLGFNFVYTNMLPKTGNIRECYVLGPKAMCLGVSKDIGVDVFRRPDKKNIPWIMLKMSAGATRMWGEHTVAIGCDETK